MTPRSPSSVRRTRGKRQGPAGHPVHDAPPALVCPHDGRAASAQFDGLCLKCWQAKQQEKGQS